MDTTAWIMVALAIVGCLLTSITLIVKVTRLISSIELLINTKVSEAKREFYNENDKLRKEVSETVVPLKTLVTNYEEKHYRLELYIRDNYIEVPTFKNAVNDIKELINEIKRNIEKMSDENAKWREKISGGTYKHPT